jgi:hypothetical protein
MTRKSRVQEFKKYVRKWRADLQEAATRCKTEAECLALSEKKKEEFMHAFICFAPSEQEYVEICIFSIPLLTALDGSDQARERALEALDKLRKTVVADERLHQRVIDAMVRISAQG